MFENKKILVLGFARSGYEVSKVLIQRNNEVVLTDLKNDDKEKEEELRNLGVKIFIQNNQEELLANLIANYGDEIISITNNMYKKIWE